MEKFLKHWDDVFKEWHDTGVIPGPEAYWEPFVEKIGLFPELMPEPYMGDPDNCSIVIMNYNPGAANYDNEEIKKKYTTDTSHHSRISDPESMVYHYVDNYREQVKKCSYIGPKSDPMYDCSGLSQEGKCWWCKRLIWIKELVPNSDKRPFTLELCGWHSVKWKSFKYTPELLDSLKRLLAPAIDEAIKNSDLGIGLCIGAQWSSVVLPHFGYEDVTSEVMDIQGYKRGWTPLGGTRRYCIWRNDKGTYIINTGKSGFKNMDVSKPEFRPVEKDMIEKINAHRQKGTVN